MVSWEFCALKVQATGWLTEEKHSLQPPRFRLELACHPAARLVRGVINGLATPALSYGASNITALELDTSSGKSKPQSDLRCYQLFSLLQRGVAVVEAVLDFALEMPVEAIT
jgi:hypothetical protein